MVLGRFVPIDATCSGGARRDGNSSIAFLVIPWRLRLRLATRCSPGVPDGLTIGTLGRHTGTVHRWNNGGLREVLHGYEEPESGAGSLVSNLPAPCTAGRG